MNMFLPPDKGIDANTPPSQPALPHVRQLTAVLLLTNEGIPVPPFGALLTQLGLHELQVQRGEALYASLSKEWWGPGSAFLSYGGRQSGALPPPERLALYRSLGFLDPVQAPLEGTYRDALLMGGRLRWVRQRLANLIQEWNRGVRFERLVMLGSGRPLLERQGEGLNEMVAPNNSILAIRRDWALREPAPRDEYQMMQLIWDQADVPAVWRQLPILWVRSEKRPQDAAPPNTERTVNDYLDLTAPPLGPVLVASSQPFAHYQTMVTAAVLAERSVECPRLCGTAGPGTPHREYAYLDQLLRRLGYELRWRRHNG